MRNGLELCWLFQMKDQSEKSTKGRTNPASAWGTQIDIRGIKTLRFLELQTITRITITFMCSLSMTDSPYTHSLFSRQAWRGSHDFKRRSFKTEHKERIRGIRSELTMTHFNTGPPDLFDLCTSKLLWCFFSSNGWCVSMLREWHFPYWSLIFDTIIYGYGFKLCYGAWARPLLLWMQTYGCHQSDNDDDIATTITLPREHTDTDRNTYTDICTCTGSHKLRPNVDTPCTYTHCHNRGSWATAPFLSSSSPSITPSD